eukprot:g4373.t1
MSLALALEDIAFLGAAAAAITYCRFYRDPHGIERIHAETKSAPKADSGVAPTAKQNTGNLVAMANVSLTDWVRMFDSKLKVKSLDDIKKWTAEDVGRYCIEVAALAKDSKTMIAVAEEMGDICKEADVDGAMLYEVITESDDESEALKTIKGWHKKIKSTVASHIFIPLDNLRKSEESKGSE